MEKNTAQRLLSGINNIEQMRIDITTVVFTLFHLGEKKLKVWAEKNSEMDMTAGEWSLHAVKSNSANIRIWKLRFNQVVVAEGHTRQALDVAILPREHVKEVHCNLAALIKGMETEFEMKSQLAPFFAAADLS